MEPIIVKYLPKQVNLATDIATIGAWDPELEEQDRQAGLDGQTDAAREKACQEGKLFLLQTWGDGDHLVEVYVNEEPADELLAAYSQLVGPYLLVSPSGRLSFGGAEDFRQATKLATRPEDEISLAPGRYALTPFMVDEDKCARSLVGDEDFDYYQKRRAGCPWGCLLVALMFVSTFVDRRIALAFLVILLIRLGYSMVKTLLRAADRKYNSIKAKIDEVTMNLEHFPAFLFVLKSIGDQDPLKGGRAFVDDLAKAP